MKKFRVTKADGTIEVIEALNLENAASIARHKFGQLPNDINTEIVNNAINSLLKLSKELEKNVSEIRRFSKDLDWDSAYNRTHKIIESLVTTGVEQSKLIGSMVKIDKEI
ncbi:MAG: hypothetical protein RR342_01210 [Bacilli bacterium]|jgi:glycosyltransferase involved in cell wall biosynthesis